MLHLLTAFILASLVPTQAQHFSETVSVPIAESLPKAFSVAIGDVNGDGRPDILVGTNGAVVVLTMGEDSHPLPGVPIPTGCLVRKLALADFDRDGTLDLAVYCPGDGQVLMFRNDGIGRFSPASRTILESTEARGMTAADLDQDGILDLAVAQPGGVTILLGNGDLTFRVSKEFLDINTGAMPMAVISADLNSDGIPDLVTANTIYNDDGSVFLGLGGGKFAPNNRVATKGRPLDLVAADFDGDGRPDLAFACQGVLVVMKNRGDGSFEDGIETTILASPASIAAADLDGDGLADLVLGTYYGGAISVLLNKGDGTFEPAKTLWSIGDVPSLAIADLNGDSIPDLIAASYSGSSLLWTLGTGNGQFGPPSYFGTYPLAFSLAVGDVDRDGMGDLAVAAMHRKTITILKKGINTGDWNWLNEYPTAISFGDFDADGVLDLAVGTLRAWKDDPGKDLGASITFFHGRGDGTFEWKAQTAVEQGGGLLTLTPADFNGDGIPDLAVRNSSRRETQILLGNGDGTFRRVQRIPLLSAMVAVDFNGDGLQELAFGLSNYGSASVIAIYAWGSDGQLHESTRNDVCYTKGTSMRYLRSFRAGDFDGDRRLDLAVNCRSDIFVLRNDGTGRFQQIPGIQVDPGRLFLSSMAVADFNQDGRDDIVATSETISELEPPGPALLLFLSDGGGKFRDPVSQPYPGTVLDMVAVDFDGDRQPDLAVLDSSDGRLKILHKF